MMKFPTTGYHYADVSAGKQIVTIWSDNGISSADATMKAVTSIDPTWSRIACTISTTTEGKNQNDSAS